MTDEPREALSHPDAETLSGHIDGELPADTASATTLHLESCAGCRESVAQLRAAREAMAEPVSPLDETTRSALVGKAVMAAQTSPTSDADAVAAPRFGQRDRRKARLLTQAAAVVAGIAIVGGAVLAARSVTSSSHSAPLSAAQAESTSTLPGASNGTGAGHTSAGGTGSAASSTIILRGEAVAVAGRPSADAVVVFRPVTGFSGAACRRPRPVAGGGLLVPVPGSSGAAGARCLELGKVIVAASPPTGVSIGQYGSPGGTRSDYLTIALTPGAARALLAGGVVDGGLSASLRRHPPVVPDDGAWRAVALRGTSLLGVVGEVVESPTATGRRSHSAAVVVGVRPSDAAQVRAALGG
jgi:hypothetical protein